MRATPLIVLAVGAACGTREPAAPPPPPAKTAVDARPPTPPQELERRARNVVGTWASAQTMNRFPEDEFPAYAALYAPTFTGVRRSGTQEVHLDRDGWLAERRRMFANRMHVKVYRAHVTLLPDEIARVRFLQDWSSGTYRDFGAKEIDVDRDGHIVREELLTSHRLAVCNPADCASNPAAACREACDAGALDDCDTLGQMYRSGHCGGNVNLVAAAAALARACEVSDTACLEAANLTSATREDDPAAARNLLERGCDMASGTSGFQACEQLADRLLTGDDGGPKNVARAIQLYEADCQATCITPFGPDGCYSLHHVYDEGLGVPKDRGRAAEYLAKAEQECGNE